LVFTENKVKTVTLPYMYQNKVQSCNSVNVELSIKEGNTNSIILQYSNCWKTDS